MGQPKREVQAKLRTALRGLFASFPTDHEHAGPDVEVWYINQHDEDDSGDEEDTVHRNKENIESPKIMINR